jgi:hypothetical protein
MIEAYGKSYYTSGCPSKVWYTIAESKKGEVDQSRRACSCAVYASNVHWYDRAGGKKPYDKDII